VPIANQDNALIVINNLHFIRNDRIIFNNIDLKIQRGQVTAIMGPSGTGKTTLLRLIAGIYKPTSGRVYVQEEITPFLEIGVGFQGDFTVRENIYINGALLGFSRKEMDRRFVNIIEFAELGKFTDIKLNKLSSGMQVRLAFAIAIQSQSPILLVDEVMAVGDSRFQNKCIDIFRQYKKNGKTIIFVSHDLSMIEEFCNQVIILEKGQIVKDGAAPEMIKFYLEKILPQG